MLKLFLFFNIFFIVPYLLTECQANKKLPLTVCTEPRKIDIDKKPPDVGK
ncbi:hypothetical protein CLOSTMETH_00309 [[Clostridium] methylpentosum DSM 5476]|uniref:Uncharacterized protein n=1 Tax=[Clostridium] methylpentosum DSM 5476 TaxID=537013 RepID=C0E914_9FIRM|nr:hypothetical protein CLOSTMETH_00309 [[Clostridium] methylpentosum DSM 5476]